MDTNTMIHPETGEILRRDIRQVEFKYKGEKITVDMPGWYPSDKSDAIFSQEDLKITKDVLRILKERVAKKELALQTA